MEGDDRALARVVAAHPGARVVLTTPSRSDFARAVGATGGRSPRVELPCDVLSVTLDGRRVTALNMVVAGVPPDRHRWWSRSTGLTARVDGHHIHDGPALGVLVANGQFLRGLDIVPRGHPGDGRAEVQVYAVPRGERRAMRERLPRGEHLPHPRIRVAAGREVEIHLARSRPVEIDGTPAGDAAALTVEVVPGAFWLLV